MSVQPNEKRTRDFEPLLNDAQAAELLGIHGKTLQRLARAGDIPAHRVGRYWRYRASEIDSWLNSEKVAVQSNRQPARPRVSRRHVTRRRYQAGCLYREKRKSGPAVWVLRYRDGDVNRKEQVGTVEEYPSRRDALQACDELRGRINKAVNAPRRTMAELIAHYRETELTEKPEGKSFSTRRAYSVYLRNWIVPAWGQHRLLEVRTVEVENWLQGLAMANGTKAKIRNLLHTLFNHAIRYQWARENPITLVRQSAKRERIPDVLTADEIRALLSQLDGPYRVMVSLAAVTGLRCSELLALKWQDCDFAAEEIRLTRAIVCAHVGALKTEASAKPIPMDAGLAALLLDWRGQCPYNQQSDYVFGSAQMEGKQPLWPSTAMSKHIRPAAERAGIKKHVRWHVFRHSFATLLKGNGEDVKTVQESLRHADSKITLDTYTQGLMPVRKAAQRKVFEAVVPTAIVQPTASA